MPHVDLFGLLSPSNPTDLQDYRKQELKNLLTSYADEADVFAEMIQNAFDAVVHSISQQLYRPDEVPTISIVVGRRANDPHYFMVCDNGVGMSQEISKNFTVLGFSKNKRLGKTVGHKGVGASFFVAASNKFAFTSQDASGFRTGATVTGAHRWIVSNNEPPPSVDDTVSFPATVQPLLPSGRGTAVYYEFHSGLKPKTLSHIVRLDDTPTIELRRWAAFLCSKTALGQCTDVSDRNIEVIICLDDGDALHRTQWRFGEFNRDEGRLGYPYPWAVFRVHKDLREILQTPEGQRESEHKNKYQALRLKWTKSELLALEPAIDFTEDEAEVINGHFEWVDVFFAYSTEVLTKVHDRIGTNARVMRYGIRIAADNVPQGRMVDFDLTSNQGLSRQAHAVVSFHGLELDLGRKIPSNEVVAEVVRKIGVRSMSMLSGYRWAMKKPQRPEPTADLEQWRSSVRERQSNSLVKALYNKLGVRAPISVDPDSEQDVVALFTSLLANQVLKGYQLAALSGFNRYDGLVNIQTAAEDLRAADDPLSIKDDSKQRGGDMRVLEFKLQFDSLIDDLEERRKAADDIDILVCWTLPDIRVTRGKLQYTHGDRKDYRELYGMTHLWTDENRTSEIPLISLKHLVAEALKQLEGASPGIGTARYAEILNVERDYSV